MAQPAETLDVRPASAVSARGRTRYEDDIYTWVQEQVALLRAGHVEALDLDQITEELNDVALAEYYWLQSAIEIVILHMLEWDHQPERRSQSWAISIAEHRERISLVLRKSPGLKSSRDGAQQNGFRLGRLRAAREMRRSLKSLPDACPYTWDEILSRPIELDADR